MKTISSIFFFAALALPLFAQGQLENVKVKLVFSGAAFETYEKKIQACIPCFLTVTNAKDSLLFKGVGASLQNNSHHFYTLKPDSIIQKQFPSIDTKVILSWSKDSINRFIQNNPSVRGQY